MVPETKKWPYLGRSGLTCDFEGLFPTQIPTFPPHKHSSKSLDHVCGAQPLVSLFWVVLGCMGTLKWVRNGPNNSQKWKFSSTTVDLGISNHVVKARFVAILSCCDNLDLDLELWERAKSVHTCVTTRNEQGNRNNIRAQPYNKVISSFINGK